MPVITRNLPRTLGGDTFILLDLKSELGDKVGANVQDKRDGSYLATYTVPPGAKRIDYRLSVRLRDAHILRQLVYCTCACTTWHCHFVVSTY